MVGSFFTQEPVLRNASSRTDVPKLSVNVCTSKTDNLATSGALWKRPMRASASIVNFWIKSVLALKIFWSFRWLVQDTCLADSPAIVKTLGRGKTVAVCSAHKLKLCTEHLALRRTRRDRLRLPLNLLWRDSL